jgi:hypothetical protein
LKTHLHYATCPTWASAVFTDCTCFVSPAWRIRKETGEQFPWRIWRRMPDSTYEPMIRASSWAAAVQLVAQLNWLRDHAVVRETHE